MAIEFLQYPASCSLAQSPIVCAVSESVSGSIASSSFQYIGELYYWTGSVNQSGSLPQFTLAKYPNTSLSGIFDFSKIINSTLEDPIEANPSNVVFLKGDFYHQYISASAFVTSSHVETGIYKAIDGYALYQEPITQSIADKTPYWPMMTDGPATQSVYDNNKGQMGAFVGDIGDDIATQIIYSGSNDTINTVALPNSANTSGQIANFPIGIEESNFPLSGDLEWYTVQAKTTTTLLGSPIRFEVICEKKYPNVRLKWKNRFGQFDFHNFNLVSREAFSTRIKTFQRQIGSWAQPTLSYENYDSATQNYSADSTQTLTVNSDYITEDYNEILKQLLVSDEIYWMYDEAGDDLRPITITTNSINFKTNVVDKLIQYSFDFQYGQAYKLIL
tara:strand:- start:1902 stop:3068 length:1167 start_codon:yes stop_codon:yes gene_type:complete